MSIWFYKCETFEIRNLIGDSNLYFTRHSINYVWYGRASTPSRPTLFIFWYIKSSVGQHRSIFIAITLKANETRVSMTFGSFMLARD